MNLFLGLLSFSYKLYHRTGKISPAALVLARPERKFHFYKKQIINKSASVIIGLVRLIILKLQLIEKAYQKV